MFEEVCREMDYWPWASNSDSDRIFPKVTQRLITNYKQEKDIGRDYFSSAHERANISPFFPLTTWPDR